MDSAQSASLPPLMPCDASPVAGKGRIPGNKGIWVGICCEFVEFLLLFAVYFVARANFPQEFTASAGRLHLWSGIWITVAMVSSSFSIAASVIMIRNGRRRASIACLVLGLLIALSYPVLKFFEIQWNLAHGINGEAGIFFTVYYYLTINHMVHAFWGILGILWVLTRHGFGIYTPENHDGLEALASYWHATDLIWLVIFPFFYVLV
ncbi:cytochrome c oxidase subunit 3 family protein [Azonexus sp.]|uniref:cytochrome c oxidase subunit 3 family protein n=1 Tax=Azonexus sp. TaxID=1872668 RepID=UPI0039E2F00A